MTKATELFDKHSAEMQAAKDKPASFDRLVDMVTTHYEQMFQLAVELEAARPEARPIETATAAALAMEGQPTIADMVKRNLRRAMDSREFYELSQAYRFAGFDPAVQIAAWEELKQYVIDNALPSHGPQSGSV